MRDLGRRTFLQALGVSAAAVPTGALGQELVRAGPTNRGDMGQSAEVNDDWLSENNARGAISSAFPTSRKPFYINRIRELSVISDVPGVAAFTTSELDDLFDMVGMVDVADKIQAIVNYAQQSGMTLKIPRVGALCSKQIFHDSRLNVECDDHAFLRWNNRESCGWKVTGHLSSNTPGYGHVRLPHMIGPNDISGYTGNAATNTYSTSKFDGDGLPCVGLEIEDFIWGKFEVMRSSGWGSAVLIRGAQYGSFNLDLKLGTIDLCKYGVNFATSNGKPVAQSRITADNIFAKFPLFFDVSATGGGAIFEWVINALGLHVAELYGCCIYTKGVTMIGPNTMTDVRITAKVGNGYVNNDSPKEVPKSYLGPLVGGDQIGPGAVAGYANGGRNAYLLHLNDRKSSTSPSFKDKGATNVLKVTAPIADPENCTSPIELSLRQGISNFNDGKPAIHKLTRVTITTTSDMPPGGFADFFFYNELICAWADLPLAIHQRDNENGLEVTAVSNGAIKPYESRMRVSNYSATIIPAKTTLSFWIDIPYA